MTHYPVKLQYNRNPKYISLYKKLHKEKNNSKLFIRFLENYIYIYIYIYIVKFCNIYILLYFVYIFNLDVKPWSVPLQVVVALRRGQIFEAEGEIKFSPVYAHDLLLL